MTVGQSCISRRTWKPQTIKRIIEYKLHRTLKRPDEKGMPKRKPEDQSVPMRLIVLSGGGIYSEIKLLKRFIL